MEMNRLKLFTLQLFLVSVMTLTASYWKTSSQTAAGAAENQTVGAVKVEEVENTLGADQANRVSNTGVDVTETQKIDITKGQIDTGKGLIDMEGADPKSDKYFSFDTEKDPVAVSGWNKIDGSGQTAQPKALGLVPFTEAPAAFDDKTNGVLPQSSPPPNDQNFDADKAKFEELEKIPDGLGPVYNAQACSECHQNPVTGAISQITELRAGHNRQMVVSGELVTIFKDAPGGSLINDRSIPTDNTLTPPVKGAKLQERVPPLLTASVVGGGSPLLREPQTVHTFRTSLNTLGDGFVEAVPNSSLIAISNSQSTVTGGVVHGEAIIVPVLEANPSTNLECQNPSLQCIRRIGRFGWKDQHASLLSFSGDAYRNEMGITNRLVPFENTSLGRLVNAFDPVPDPEDKPNGNPSREDIDRFAEFMRSTKAPPRDPDIINQFSASVSRGRKLFTKLPTTHGDSATYSCSVCHVPALVTAPPGTTINGGKFTVPPSLGNKIFRPFSDFLLHDVGTGDGIVQNGPQEDTVPVQRSTRNKMRTPPLWGVRTRNRLMHDGQSLTFLEAIQRHGGESLSVTNRFMALPDEVNGVCPLIIGCKQDVIRFLESL
jgi:CxxC motif-containing protein (DUF1111 family)